MRCTSALTSWALYLSAGFCATVVSLSFPVVLSKMYSLNSHNSGEDDSATSLVRNWSRELWLGLEVLVPHKVNWSVIFCSAWLYWLLPRAKFFRLNHCCAQACWLSQVLSLLMPYSKMTVISFALEQSLLIKQNTNLPSPQGWSGSPNFLPVLRSNLLTM